MKIFVPANPLDQKKGISKAKRVTVHRYKEVYRYHLNLVNDCRIPLN